MARAVGRARKCVSRPKANPKITLAPQSNDLSAETPTQTTCAVGRAGKRVSNPKAVPIMAAAQSYITVPLLPRVVFEVVRLAQRIVAISYNAIRKNKLGRTMDYHCALRFGCCLKISDLLSISTSASLIRLNLSSSSIIRLLTTCNHLTCSNSEINSASCMS